jgi:hypothetical protein
MSQRTHQEILRQARTDGIEDLARRLIDKMQQCPGCGRILSDEEAKRGTCNDCS